MGYPLPKVGGTTLSPKSKAYECIAKGTVRALDSAVFDEAVTEQYKLWRYASKRPAELRNRDWSPEKVAALAYLVLETLREIAIESVSKAQEHLKLSSSLAAQEIFEVVLDIQVNCAEMVAEKLDSIKNQN
jgi:hypothetical protein